MVFKAFLALISLKSFNLCLLGIKLGAKLYLVYFVALKWLEFRTIVICVDSVRGGNDNERG